MSFLNDFFDVREADVDEMDRIYADYLAMDPSHDVAAVQMVVISCKAPEMCRYMMRQSIEAIRSKYREIVEQHDFACVEEWPDEDDDVWFNFQDSHYAGFLGRYLSDSTPGSLSNFDGAEDVVKNIIHQQMDKRIRGLAHSIGISSDPFGLDASEEVYQIIRKYIAGFNECDLDRFYDPDTLTYLLPEGVAKQIAQETCIVLDLKGNPLS
ncbi:MAG: hypothetical protein IBX55_01635 [Methyloprofundus sp.]|nr:hypothetical protein [Methyloprofundus sp.]